MSILSMEEMGNGFCPNFFLPFLEKKGRRGRDDRIREFIHVLHSPHLKVRPSPPVVALTLEYFLGVPYGTASCGREKKQVRIRIRKTREYLECANRLSINKGFPKDKLT